MRWRRGKAALAGAATMLLAAGVVFGVSYWRHAAANAARVKRPAAGGAQRAARTEALAVGALFTVSGGHLGDHFCTGSVVDSPSRDLVLTAAHCLTGFSITSPSGLAFVPDYNGGAPLGVWTVVRIYVDPAWTARADPDHDVAFLRVVPADSLRRIEAVTGALTVGFAGASVTRVRVIGYPDGANRPVVCDRGISWHSATQMEFDCENFASGTSGGPFLAGPDSATGAVVVIGVIGGYEDGGLTPDVSYAAAFGPDVRALYQRAIWAA